MTNPINNSVFDSRDLIEYKEYLESELIDLWNELDEDRDASDIDEVDLNELFEHHDVEVDDYRDIAAFVEELEGYGDFEYGETIIHEDYFTEYCEDLVEDIGYISKDLPGFIRNNIDWEGVADELKLDYTSATYCGDTYYMRG